MSRMGEFAMEQDRRDLEDAALYQYEQEVLQRDPAYAAWLDRLNAGNLTQQEPNHERPELDELRRTRPQHIQVSREG